MVHENPKREKITIHEIDYKLRKLKQKQDQICVYLPKSSSKSRNPMKITMKNEEEKEHDLREKEFWEKLRKVKNWQMILGKEEINFLN